MQTVKVPMESLYEVILLQLQNGGKANLVVTGVSMKPMLKEGRDTVILAPITTDPVTGDIVLYRRDNGKFVLHRIIRVTPEGYLISGDNQYELEAVSRQQMLAVVSAFTRKGRSHTLREPGYRLYRWAWVKLFWLRKPYIKLRRKLGRVYRRLIHRRNAE